MTILLKNAVRMRTICKAAALGAAVLLTVPMQSAEAAGPGNAEAAVTEISPGLVMPKMDSAKGKSLFVSKECVVCHSVNGIGGTDAPRIDASTMKSQMNPFDFVARMWNHSMGMAAMQMHELGDQILFDNGQQIADIIAFLHDADAQATFSDDDLTEDVKSLLEEGEEDEGHGHMMEGGGMTGSGGMGGGMMGSGGMMGGSRKAN